MAEEKDKYDYEKDIATLEALLKEVEDPATSLTDMERVIKEAEVILSRSREYLHGFKDKLENIN